MKRAILHEQHVIARYKGGVREMCPHAIGTRRGEARALFYQFAGFSESGLGADGSTANWRCIKLDELEDVSTRAGDWHTAQGDAHTRPSECIDSTDIEWWADVAAPRGRRRSWRLTALIEREDDGFVALCPEFDVASQGDTVEDARTNLLEALELFLESASDEEIQRRFHSDIYVTSLEVAAS